MKFTTEEVLKIANIAHLSLTAEELELFAKDLEKMLAFSEQLSQLDHIGEESPVGEATLYNVFRKDEIKPSMAKEELLGNAPKEKNGCFFVPQTVE